MLQLESFIASSASQELSKSRCWWYWHSRVDDWSLYFHSVWVYSSYYIQQAKSLLVQCVYNWRTKPQRLLNIKAALKENMHIHLGPCFFFYRECLKLSSLLRILSQGKSARAFILISSQHKEEARTLEVFREIVITFSLHFTVYTFDPLTFYVIQFKTLKRYKASLFSSQHPLFTLSIRTALQIRSWMRCSRICSEK